MTRFLPVFATAFFVSLVLTPLVRRIAHRAGTLDHPGGRKSHAQSTPRLGGIAIALAWLAGLGVAIATAAPLELPVVPMLAGGLFVFVVGLWDDLRPLGPEWKLLAQTLAAAAIAGAGISIERMTFFGSSWHLGWFAVGATMIWIIILTNAFNLMDGLDGLAAGLALIAGVTCTAIVLIRGERDTALVLVALIGGLAGFLPFNFNPATIFLGDAGSLLIGFVLAVTAITGFQKGATVLASAIPLLVFAIPILDTLAAISRRALGRGPANGRMLAFGAIFQPDRRHIHHYLMARGLSHRAAVLVLYGVALCLSGVALATMERP